MFVDLATLLIECPAALLFLIGIHPKNQNAFQVRIVKCWQPAGRGRAHACQRPTSFLRTLQSCTQRVNDRRRFYAHFEDLALGLADFCDMVWILHDFDVSAAILVDVR